MRDENKNIIPLWGPYSKKYMGISRIMKESAVPGARFDFVIHPTYANSNVPAPNVTIPSEYHPWDCDSNGKYYRYRYELLWKDQLYAYSAFRIFLCGKIIDKAILVFIRIIMEGNPDSPGFLLNL